MSAPWKRRLPRLKVWAECHRVLVGGGRICCVVGDVCIPRGADGRHRIMPLHADIQVRARRLGLDCLTPIIWHKIANGVTESEGNGAGFYGKPYQPGAILKNDLSTSFSSGKAGSIGLLHHYSRKLCPCSARERSSRGSGRSGPTSAGHQLVTGTPHPTQSSLRSG